MAIKFFCSCGKKLKASAEQAGKRGQCTACGRAVQIPIASEPSPAVVELTPVESPWYFSRHGQVFGPMPLGEMCALVNDGRLLPGDWVLRAGSAHWTAARENSELYSLIPSPPIVAPIPTTPAAEICGKAASDVCSAEFSTEEPLLLGPQFDSRRHVLAEAQVVSDASRCVQCGICSHNCPMNIDVRSHARRGKPINDSRCLTCSECVNRCPRGVLQFERLSLFLLEI